VRFQVIRIDLDGLAKVLLGVLFVEQSIVGSPEIKCGLTISGIGREGLLE
jgi:hypothetical protein